MTVMSDVALPAGYARWQERLGREFFGGRQNQPVVLFMDRDELQQIASEGEDGLDSLTSAVRELVDVSHGAMMFTDVMRAEVAWNMGARRGPPPTLPVLALSILAASDMHSDTSGARHNTIFGWHAPFYPVEPTQSSTRSVIAFVSEERSRSSRRCGSGSTSGSVSKPEHSESRQSASIQTSRVASAQDPIMRQATLEMLFSYDVSTFL
ncbi:hypothetical protein AB0E63_36890 [Kribbella sp. NPDC026596]|uniref:hypothetical protein n=1 Tax=Kribbella sp. NPDC026596 TaxID=3155122 RepID=UPI0034032A5E